MRLEKLQQKSLHRSFHLVFCHRSCTRISQLLRCRCLNLQLQKQWFTYSAEAFLFYLVQEKVILNNGFGLFNRFFLAGGGRGDLCSLLHHLIKFKMIKIITSAALAAAAKASEWQVYDHSLHFNSEPVVLHGFGVDCTEYMLRTIGTKCFAAVNWSDPANVITELN